MASAAAASAAAAAAEAAASEPADSQEQLVGWRNLKKTSQGKRFKLSDEQKAQSKKLYDHLPRLHKRISKVSEVSGQEAMAIVTDRLPKRARGKQSKDASKPKHTTATLRVVLTGAQATRGVTGQQAKQLLTGQLQNLLGELKKPSTAVQFVKAPKPRKAAIADAAPAAQDALMDSYDALANTDPEP